jgi:hypothetical protein
MSNRRTLIGMVTLGVVAWVGLLAFMNLRPADSTHQMVFLLLWAVAIWATMSALSYLLNARLATSHGPQADLNRALRQGLFLSILGTVIRALRFLHMLTPFTAITLALVTVLMEALIAVRTR